MGMLRSSACRAVRSCNAWLSSVDFCTEPTIASASTATPESAGPARMRLIASRSRSSPSRSTFMSSKPANVGSVGYRRLGVTGAAPPAYWVTARTRNVFSAVSASRRLARARASWVSRIWVS